MYQSLSFRKSGKKRGLAVVAAVALAGASLAALAPSAEAAAAADAGCNAVGRTIRDPNSGFQFKNHWTCKTTVEGAWVMTPPIEGKGVGFAVLKPGINTFVCYSSDPRFTSAAAKKQSGGHYWLLTADDKKDPKDTTGNSSQLAPITAGVNAKPEMLAGEKGWGWVSAGVLDLPVGAKPTKIAECGKNEAKSPNARPASSTPAAGASSGAASAPTPPAPPSTKCVDAKKTWAVEATSYDGVAREAFTFPTYFNCNMKAGLHRADIFAQADEEQTVPIGTVDSYKNSSKVSVICQTKNYYVLTQGDNSDGAVFDGLKGWGYMKSTDLAGVEGLPICT